MSQKPQRLIFVMTRLNRKGGQELSTLEVLQRLEPKGWEVHVLSYVLEEAPSNTNFIWHRVPFYKLPTHWLRDFWLGLYSWFWLTFFAPQALVVTVGVGSWKADVRVIQFFHSKLRAWVKADRAVFPMSQTFVRKTYQNFYSAYNCFLERICFRNSRRLIAISETVASDLKDLLGLAPKKVEVIHHAPAKVHSREESSTKLTRILFVGAMERKGIEKALEILALLKDLNWQFDVVGDGDIPFWKKHSTELGISDRVQFHGVRPSSLYFPKADIFLFPSLYEPFGLVVTEAVSFGLAVVASSECGALELWPNRPEVLKLSVQDSNAKWAEALRLLIQDGKLRSEVVRQAQVSVGAWNWDLAADRYHEVFLKCLNEK